MASKLVAAREKYDTKRAELAKVFELAGDSLDFDRKEVLDHLGASDGRDAVAKVRERNREVEELYDSAKALADLETIRDGLEDGIAGPTVNRGGLHHADPGFAGAQSIGDLIIGSEPFKAYQKSRSPVSGEVGGYGLRDVRATLLESTTGIPPENVRSGRLVEAVTRPIQVLDIIPTGTTGGNAYKYEEEVLRTHSAVEMREGAAYAEDAFKWAERMEPVIKVGTSLPVTDEQFEDVPGLASYLNMRMTFGIRQRIDLQVLVGNGTPANISGILDRVGLQTQAKGADAVPDTVHKGMTKVRVTGRAMPSHVIMHPNDWQDIRLLRTADGIYIWGAPSEAGPARIWGLPVVQADSLTEGTGIVGDFTFCQLLERRGLDVQVGYVNDDFGKGKKTVRADVRIAFCVYRAAAFCSLTGI